MVTLRRVSRSNGGQGEDWWQISSTEFSYMHIKLELKKLYEIVIVYSSKKVSSTADNTSALIKCSGAK